MLIETLAAQVPAARAARLSDNIREELAGLRSRDRATRLELPQRTEAAAGGGHGGALGASAS